MATGALQDPASPHDRGRRARAGTDGASLRFNADHAQAAGVAAALHGALMGGRCRRWRGPRQAGGLHSAVIPATIRP